MHQGAAFRTGASRRFHLLFFTARILARGGGALTYLNAPPAV